ncbi:hypothetical protein [Tateyamaria sp.]|uniref:hypothetical protein n=1 Tax=Tateyamaria sp. TaxID=1929288 RepID=UPI003B21EFB3
MTSPFTDLARMATGLDISPTWQRGTGSEADIEVTSTDQAEYWSVYLRLMKGEARVLHDARTIIGAARALAAAGRGYGLPVTLEAWDIRCEAECARGLCTGGLDRSGASSGRPAERSGRRAVEQGAGASFFMAGQDSDASPSMRAAKCPGFPMPGCGNVRPLRPC